MLGDARRMALEAVGEADRACAALCSPRRGTGHRRDCPRPQDGDVEGDVGIERVVAPCPRPPSIRSRPAVIASRWASSAYIAASAAASGSIATRSWLNCLSRSTENLRSSSQRSTSVSNRFHAGRLDTGALARPRAQQALGGQHLDRLAGDRAADLVLAGKLGLGREGLCLIDAGDDRPAEAFEQPVGQVAAETGAAPFIAVNLHPPPNILFLGCRQPLFGGWTRLINHIKSHCKEQGRRRHAATGPVGRRKT